MAGLMTHQYKKLPVTMKMWMQFNVMPNTSLGVDAVYIYIVMLDRTAINVRAKHISK